MSLRRRGMAIGAVLGILLSGILWETPGLAQSNIPGRTILGPSTAVIGHIICDSGCGGGGGGGGLTDAELRATPVDMIDTTLAPIITLAGPFGASALSIQGVDGAWPVRTKDDFLAGVTAVIGDVSSGAAIVVQGAVGGIDLPVTGPLTNTQLRAVPVPISGTVTTGGLTDVQLRATPVPISGTVSTGGLTDTQLRATPVPISGTVTTGGLTDVQLRATPVPVSGPLTDTQLRATPVPVSGTLTAVTTVTSLTQMNGQAIAMGTGVRSAGTQRVTIATDDLVPVSGTITANAGTNLNTSALALDATQTNRTQKSQITDGTRDGLIKAASTLPLLTDTAFVVTQRDPLPAGTNVIGHFIADSGSTTAVTGTVTVIQATPANLTATVTPIAITKGTQSATGFTTQDLKDAGRNITTYFHAAPVATTTGEVMQSLTGYKGGIAVGATVTPAVVTSGKTYRVTSVEITFIASTAIGQARVNLRANLSGSGVVGSPLVKTWQVGQPAIFTAGAAMTYVFDYPDGMEFAAGTGIAIGVIGEGADGTTGTAVGKVLVAVHGYEY